MDRTPRTGPRNPEAPDYTPKPGKHVRNGWPHLSSITRACMCDQKCCVSRDGLCNCAQCSGFGHTSCPKAHLWSLGEAGPGPSKP